MPPTGDDDARWSSSSSGGTMPATTHHRWPHDPNLRSEHVRRVGGMLRYLSDSLADKDVGTNGAGMFVREFDDDRRPNRGEEGEKSAAVSTSSSRSRSRSISNSSARRSAESSSGLGAAVKEALRSEYFAGLEGGGGEDGGDGGGGGEVMLSPSDLRCSSCFSFPHADDDGHDAAAEGAGCWIRLTRPRPASTSAVAQRAAAPTPPPQPPILTPLVDQYLERWAEQRGLGRNTRRLLRILTMQLIESAPSLEDLLGPDVGTRIREEVDAFLRRYRRYLRRIGRTEQQSSSTASISGSGEFRDPPDDMSIGPAVSAAYGRLFDCAQGCSAPLQRGRSNAASRDETSLPVSSAASAFSSDRELVIGLGLARCVIDYDSDPDRLCRRVRVVNGPLLEVRAEIELSPSGALLVRPKLHGGISLNSEVLSAVASDRGRTDALGRLRRAAAEMDAGEIRLDNPSTYGEALRIIAVELCPGGRFVPSSSSGGAATAPSSSVSASSSSASASRSAPSSSSSGAHNQQGSVLRARLGRDLVVTDAFCVYARPRPVAPWARDAAALADAALLSLSSSSFSSNIVPRAALSLTHGPGALEGALRRELALKSAQQSSAAGGADDGGGGGLFGSLRRLLWGSEVAAAGQSFARSSATAIDDGASTRARPLFPLPSSAAQERIVRLLDGGCPAVVVEGPPGCGKTHSIANVVCSYLARGKRVLVTSKSSPALAVLRDRLPDGVRELCVDCAGAGGESGGMRQLRAAAERLADRVAETTSAGGGGAALCAALENEIATLDDEISAIDGTLWSRQDRRRALLRTPACRELIRSASAVVSECPWMAATLFESSSDSAGGGDGKSSSSWSAGDVQALLGRAEALLVAGDDPMRGVSGFPSPPGDEVLSEVAARAGCKRARQPSLFAGLAGAVSSALSASGGAEEGASAAAEEDLARIRINRHGDRVSPRTESDWALVLRAMERAAEHREFYAESISKLVEKEGWPLVGVYEEEGRGEDTMGTGGAGWTTRERYFRRDFIDSLRLAARVRALRSEVFSSDAAAEGQGQVEVEDCRALEARRHGLAGRVQSLSCRLVEARVASTLGTAFSPDAQSALIRFAQAAGRSRMRGGSGSRSARLSHRQQRHRREYLEAFEQCVRWIPCWILTGAQICEYLPAELGMFDLVVVDEASQSDVTSLPAMLRGERWLVVGDGKQVSPTEGFIAEERIERLQSALPEGPFRGLFLPGRSIFDLCAQAFPQGRVVLQDHYRCAPELIQFSNANFYNGRLHPLKVPTSAERMPPSIVDVYLPNGRKVGKTNEQEADAIVKMIQDVVESPESTRAGHPKRSIGVICLLGDEQSRLIRRCLLDAVGPKSIKDHDISVGEPPVFQGAERDIIFLSMVCSPGRVPTQNQLMHDQRFNVAMSRAKYRLVLVRSLKRGDVPNGEDAKIPVLEFFSRSSSSIESGGGVASQAVCTGLQTPEGGRKNESNSNPGCLRSQVAQMVTRMLESSGFVVRPMSDVWDGALCVENKETSARAAIMVEAGGELKEDWEAAIDKQRSIERVGWQCMRIDALSYLLHCNRMSLSITQSLTCVGVERCGILEVRDTAVTATKDTAQHGIGEGESENADGSRHGRNQQEDEGAEKRDIADNQRRPPAVDNGVCADAVSISSNDDDVSSCHHVACEQKPRRRKRPDLANSSSDDAESSFHTDSDDSGAVSAKRKRRRKPKYRRLDSYSRDGRWYPGQHKSDGDEKLVADEGLADDSTREKNAGDTERRQTEHDNEARVQARSSSEEHDVISLL